jgi:hypothetical protein
MPTPITFSVPARQRQGTFSSQVISYPGGYSRIYWELAIPKTAEYEDVTNQVTSQLFVNGVDPAGVWQGGRNVNKLGVVDAPPAEEFDITQVPAGATLQVVITVNNPMTIGIQNGVIS